MLIARTTRTPLGLAAAAIVLTGCTLPGFGTPTADRPVVRPGELAEAGNRPCPHRMSVGDDPFDHGFGTHETADERPALLEPQKAWVCQYYSFDVGTAPKGGTILGWRLVGGPDPVDSADIPQLRAALAGLVPADRSGGCTADLGPRWMVVYSHDGDLTAVVVDDYGCRDVRLTDDPQATPPGADDQDGTVGGVLDGGPGILAAVGVGGSN
jgi:hypothetical protein